MAKVKYGAWGGHFVDGKLVPASGWLFICPGCKTSHWFEESRWTFNGDVDKPTFAPSLLVRTGPWPEGCDRAGAVDVCHSFVRDGKIEFLSDCTHKLADKTVDLEEIKQ